MTPQPKYSLTRVQALALNPCSEHKVPDFGGKEYFTPQDAFDAGVSASDFMWVLGRTGHKWIAVKMAIKYAEHVARLNSDPRVQAAIDAAWKVVADPNDSSARAAADAAYGAYAAYAAARAAVYAAADAAADAAYAAAAAAAAAADAAAAAAAADAAAAAARAAVYAAADAAADAAYAAAAAAADAAAAAAYAALEPMRGIDVFNAVTAGE